MKTIGLIGGMSWESTSHYYTLINQAVKEKLGGFNSAKLVLVSVNFAEIESLQQSGNWQTAGRLLAQAALQLQAAGADFFLIGTNTMHKVADQVAAAVNIPLLHIVDATGREINRKGFKRVALLGTRFTMSETFYSGHLANNFNIEIVLPDKDDQDIIHNIIYQELCLGKIHEPSRQEYLRIIHALAEQGAEAVILGCTEIGLLIQPQNTQLPLLDTTQLHAVEAVSMALENVNG